MSKAKRGKLAKIREAVAPPVPEWMAALAAVDVLGELKAELDRHGEGDQLPTGGEAADFVEAARWIRGFGPSSRGDLFRGLLKRRREINAYQA